ncbi:MAG: EamA family transporter [Clostridia bacterium]
MSSLAIGLALVSAVLHVGWNAALRGASATIRFVWVETLAGGLVGFVLVVATHDWSLHGALVWALITVGIHVVYFLALVQAYRTGALSVVYPGSRGLGVLLTVPAAAWLLAETLDPIVIAGVVLVGLGLMGAIWQDWGAASRKTYGWTALVGLTVMAYSLVDSHAMHLMQPPLYITIQFWGTAFFLTPLALREPAGGSLRTPALAGLASLLSYVLILYAYRLAPVGAVLALRQLAPALAPLAATLWLRERPSWQQALGAVAVSLGAILIIWA